MTVVVDAHIHVWPDRRFMPEHVWETFHWVWGRRFLGTSDPEMTEALLEEAWDPAGHKLIAEMDDVGILASVAMPMDFGLAIGEAALSIREKNQLLAELARNSDGRIFTFCGVDPRRPEAADLIREAVASWACRGVKLYPATGFVPDDPICRSTYEVAVELGVPVLFHPGPVGYPLKSKYSRPSEIDAVAAEYPDLRIVLGHVSYGRAWFDEALDIAALKPNLLLEVSGLAGYATDAATLRPLVRRMIDTIGVDRILCGSDRVGFPGGGPGWWLDLWKSLPGEPDDGSPSLTRVEIDVILGGNADREYGLGLLDQPGHIDIWPSFPATPFRHTPTDPP